MQKQTSDMLRYSQTRPMKTPFLMAKVFRRYVRRQREMRLRAEERAAAARGRVAELEVT